MDRRQPAPEPRNASSDASVELMAGSILGAAIVFLLLQVLIVILVAVVGILAGERIGLACGALAEATLIAALVRMVRRTVSHQPSVGSRPATIDESPALERQLERLMMVGALLGVAACLLMGLGLPGLRVFLTVVESFAALFLLIVIATRWFLTRKVSALALAALIVTGYSLWLALRHFPG